MHRTQTRSIAALRRGAARRTQTLIGIAGTVTACLIAGCSEKSEITGGPPAVSGTIAINLTPASMTLAPGGSSGAGITVTGGGGFSGAVTLSASGVPSGVTLTFSPVTVGGGESSSLNVVVPNGATPGTTEISIIGRSGSLVSQAAKLTLRIQ